MYRKDSVMGKIRMMDVGDSMEFPLSDWGKCRTAAYYLKADYGVMYRVRKSNDKVIVTRVDPEIASIDELTPEALMKLGFSKSKTHHGVYVFLKNGLYLRYYFAKRRMVFRFGAKPALYGTVTVKYLYELQTLAALLRSKVIFKK